MRIKSILSQSRRDFVAIYICEHCKYEEKSSGYDDTYFHDLVIPDMACPKCQKTAPETYKALQPKYPSHKFV